jgi:REP element-mobilizing transposase RayT
MEDNEPFHTLYVHIVWKTKSQLPLLMGPIDVKLREHIVAVCREKAYELIAFNTLPDHAHALVKLLPTHVIDTVALDLKGGSNVFESHTPDGWFGVAWDESYGAFSIGTLEVAELVQFMRSQPRFVETGPIFDYLEE